MRVADTWWHPDTRTYTGYCILDNWRCQEPLLRDVRRRIEEHVNSLLASKVAE